MNRILCLAVWAVAVSAAPADSGKELDKMKGTWAVESREVGGEKQSADAYKDVTVTFDGDKYTVKKGDKVLMVGTQKIDTSKKPMTVDSTVTEGPDKGSVMLGIFELDGDTLKVCFDPEGKKRPAKFKTAEGTKQFFNVHKRAKK